jgi:hypothetical protein
MADALGLAVNVIAVVDLLVKIGVLCSEYCTGLKTARHDVRYILNEANKLAATLSDVKLLLAGPNGAKIEASHNVRRGVTDSQLLLNDLASKLEAGIRYKWMLWPLKKEEVMNIIKKLERCTAAISIDLQLNQMYVPLSWLELVLKIVKDIASRHSSGDYSVKVAHCRRGHLRFPCRYR